MQAEASLGQGRACVSFILSLLLATDQQTSRSMSSRRPQAIIQQARERIARIRDTLGSVDYLCSGTLLQRMKLCGKPGCRCAEDPAARHGPYYEWGHMKGGKLVHRTVSPEQAAILRLAITNYRKVKKLLRSWEVQTERLIDAEEPPQK